MLNFKITLYGVVKLKENQKLKKSDIEQILTLTRNKKSCKEFIYHLVYIEHYDHFISWCELHDLPNTEEAFNQYLLLTQYQNEYKIIKFIYPLENIAAILRMYLQCIPIGCSFDKKEEYDNFLMSLSSKELDKFKNTIKEY